MSFTSKTNNRQWFLWTFLNLSSTLRGFKKNWIYNKQNNYQYDSVESIKNDKWKKNTNKITTIFVLVHRWMVLLVNQPRYDEWHANNDLENISNVVYSLIATVIYRLQFKMTYNWRRWLTSSTDSGSEQSDTYVLDMHYTYRCIPVYTYTHRCKSIPLCQSAIWRYFDHLCIV